MQQVVTGPGYTQVVVYPGVVTGPGYTLPWCTLSYYPALLYCPVHHPVLPCPCTAHGGLMYPVCTRSGLPGVPFWAPYRSRTRSRGWSQERGSSRLPGPGLPDYTALLYPGRTTLPREPTLP